jgi:hypothetical protein
MVLDLPTRVLVVVTWDQTRAQIQVNGRLLRTEPDVAVAAIIPSSGRAAPGPPSFEREEARSRCAVWMAERAKAHGARPLGAGVANRRRVEVSEELEALGNEVAALTANLARVRSGEPWHLSAIRASLRGLLYDRGSSYTPLLYRVAARFDLPLPVFVPSAQPPSVAGQVSAFHGSTASIRQWFIDEELVDLQEWLESPGYVPSGAPGHSLTLKEILGKAANTLGGAHHARDIPIELDYIRDHNVAGFDALTAFVLHVGDIVAVLAAHAITVARARTDAAPPLRP